MSARKEQRSAEQYQRIGERWRSLMGDVAPPPHNAPTDAATSGWAIADAAGAPHGRHVDTERDG